MESPQNPFGLHTITPYLIVNDIEKLIPFLNTVFGARQRGEIKYREDGSVMHAEIVIGNSVVMMGSPGTEYDVMPATLYTYVEDCDATYQLALDQGATSVMEPMNLPHGDRYGGVKDLAGNIWWVVTHVGKED